MKKFFLCLSLLIVSFFSSAEESTSVVTHNVDGVITTITKTVYVPDSCKSWYNPDRIYYEKTPKYTIGDFFNALDLPTVFGLGFNPTGREKGIGYYSQMFLEWRRWKTYGWFVCAGLDSHNQKYNWSGVDGSSFFPTDWTPSTGVFVFGKNNAKEKLLNSDMNVVSGTIYNMELLVGPGYRIPLVKDIKGYYEHPYVCDWNLSLCAQFGYAWSNMNNINVWDKQSGVYEINDVNYIHPVMKFDAAVEWFTGPYFSIFAMASYMQHLTTMPWDNQDTHAGTLAFSVGFAGFFN